MNRVTVIGSGGHARSVAGVLVEELMMGIAAFVDLGSALNASEEIYGAPVIPLKGMLIETIESIGAKALVLAIGDNVKREQVYRELKGKYAFPNIIAHGARVYQTVQMGEANVVLSHAHLGPYCKIGDNNLINTRAIVEHECRIGNSNHIAPGSIVLGRAQLGDRCFICAGAAIKPQVVIGNDVILGANAFANQNLSLPGTYVGAPAAQRKAP